MSYQESMSLGSAVVCLQSLSLSLSLCMRREPMEGCLSTLEAVALALKELEPGESGENIQQALLQAFRGMVNVQDQFRRQGRERQLQMYKGVTKEQAMQEKKLQSQQATDESGSMATPSLAGLSIRVPAEEAAAPALRTREYVFYLTQQDFRQRKQLVQQVRDVLNQTGVGCWSLMCFGVAGTEHGVDVQRGKRALPEAQQGPQARPAPGSTAHRVLPAATTAEGRHRYVRLSLGVYVVAVSGIVWVVSL